MLDANTINDVCPICGERGKSWLTTTTAPDLTQYPLGYCRQCHHSYLQAELPPDHVRQQYADHYFLGGGAGYSDYLASEEVVRAHSRQYVTLLQRRGLIPGRVVAVGAAAGFDLLPFRDAGCDVVGIEPNRMMCDYAQQRLGLSMLCRSLEEPLFSDNDGCGDSPIASLVDQAEVVIALQVMGHLASPKLAATRLAQLVKTDGVLLVETWNSASWTARILGRHWHEYSPPTVVQWYSPRSLRRLMSAVGFAQLATGRPGKSIRGDHAASLLRYRLGMNPLSKLFQPLTHLIPRRMVFPYPAEDLFWSLFIKRSSADASSTEMNRARR